MTDRLIASADVTLFAERFRELRAVEDLTQQAMAEALDVAVNSVQGWERGANLPSAAVLERIACLFPDWSVDYLLGLTSRREPNRSDDEQSALRAAAAAASIRRGRRRRRTRSGDARPGRGTER